MFYNLHIKTRRLLITPNKRGTAVWILQNWANSSPPVPVSSDYSRMLMIRFQSKGTSAFSCFFISRYSRTKNGLRQKRRRALVFPLASEGAAHTYIHKILSPSLTVSGGWRTGRKVRQDRHLNSYMSAFPSGGLPINVRCKASFLSPWPAYSGGAASKLFRIWMIRLTIVVRPLR